MENETIAPFRLLQSTSKKEVGFLVLEPTSVVKGYYDCVRGAQVNRRSLGL